MFTHSFEHYLSFGATDQETFRVLDEHYNGIIVPGTIAVLQREGTGGFLLALSAAAARTAYVIDPRSPLFQQALPRLKRAQIDLAEVLERKELATTAEVSPSDFDTARCETLAERWVHFNESYRDSSGGKFEKYAKRLGQAVSRPNAQGPELIMPPYFVANSAADPWAKVNKEIFTAATGAAAFLDVIPVIATERESALPELAEGFASDRAIIWVSDFNERDVDSERLVAYGRAVRSMSERTVSPFALYGGYFSIALRHVGLCGFNHGVGFGDSRAWRELPNSGPPLPRYYLTGAHRYVSPEFAQELYGLDADLVACPCEVCEGRPPLTLNYHALMQHSVLSREREILESSNWDLGDVAADLDT